MKVTPLVSSTAQQAKTHSLRARKKKTTQQNKSIACPSGRATKKKHPIQETPWLPGIAISCSIRIPTKQGSKTSIDLSKLINNNVLICPCWFQEDIYTYVYIYLSINPWRRNAESEILPCSLSHRKACNLPGPAQVNASYPKVACKRGFKCSKSKKNSKFNLESWLTY